jgi:hypothetical protein
MTTSLRSTGRNTYGFGVPGWLADELLAAGMLGREFNITMTDDGILLEPLPEVPTLPAWMTNGEAKP